MISETIGKWGVEQMKKKLAVIIASVICCMVVSGFSFFIGTQDQEIENEKEVKQNVQTESRQEEPLKTFDVVNSEESEKQKIFTNYVDGFSILIPEDLEVDMSLANIRTCLHNDKWQIEIYRQELEQNTSPETYIQYSNQFMANKADHKKELAGDFQLAGKSVHVLQWSRNKLSRVADDKNYYASADLIVSEREVYSFFFKSTEPFYGCDQYLNIVGSFYQLPTEARLVMDEQKGGSGVSQGEPSLAAGQWNEQTRAVYERYFSADSSLTWGLFEFAAPENFTTLHQLEETMNYEFPFLVYYKHFNREGKSPNMLQGLQNAKEEGRILELTLQTTAQNEEEGNMVYDILNGEFDPFIDSFIKDIKTVKTPVLLRFCNEMNGDWCMYSSYHTSKDTELFIKMYQYLYEKFREADALQYTIWVWNPNEKSLPAFQWNASELYYPGDMYVDIIGMTGYNTGTYYPGETWRSFDEIYEKPYEWTIKNFDKPIMITEFSSSSTGGEKEAWIEDMFRSIGGYDKIKVAIWWSGMDLDAEGNIARNYRIDERPQILTIFRDYLSQYRSENVT